VSDPFSQNPDPDYPAPNAINPLSMHLPTPLPPLPFGLYFGILLWWLLAHFDGV